MDNQDIITEASQLVASFWDTEKAKQAEERQENEEPIQDAPPCAEAVEDEVRMLEAVINADLKQRMERDGVADIELHARILDIDRVTGAGVPLWNIGACVEGHCDDPECTKRHHRPKRFLVAKQSDGTAAVLGHDDIYDIIDQNQECFEPELPAGAIRIDLNDLVEHMAKKTVEVVTEEMQKSKAGPDDDLPPAAIEEPTEIAVPPDSDEQLDLFRRAWHWLRRR